MNQNIMNLKNIIIITLFTFGVISAFGQAPSYQKFELELQLGYAQSSKLDLVNNAFLMGAEVRYNLMDDLSIGIESQASLFPNVLVEEASDLHVVSSGLLSLDRYIINDPQHKWVYGVALGEYNSRRKTWKEGGVDETSDQVRSFGVAFRLAYELKHMRFKAQYNYLTEDAAPNHLSLSIGYVIGGRYKGE